MNIIFDVHIANPNLANETTLEQNILLNEIYSFVEERIKVLQEKIEDEENANDGKPKATVIYLKSKAIQPRGYSEPLCSKIIGCFSPKDIEIMWLRVEKSLYNLLN